MIKNPSRRNYVENSDLKSMKNSKLEWHQGMMNDKILSNGNLI